VRVITQRSTDLGNPLMDRTLLNDSIRPNFVKQLTRGNDLTRVVEQVREHVHRLGLKLFVFITPSDTVQMWLD